MPETILGYYIGTTILFGAFTVINTYLYFISKRRDKEFEASRLLMMNHVDDTMIRLERETGKIKEAVKKKLRS